MKLKSKISLKNVKEKIVDNINGAIEKIGTTDGMQTRKSYKKKENKKYMYLKQASYSISSLVNMTNQLIKGQDISSNIDKYGSVYRFYNSQNRLIFTSDYKSSLMLDKETITLYDDKKQKIGYVKENVFSMRVPLFEKDAKKCSIHIGEDIAKIKKYVSFGDLTFETLEGKMYIAYNNSKDQNKHTYTIKKGDKDIAKVTEVPLIFVDGYIDRFIIEYDQKEDEEAIALMTIALTILLS